MICKICKLDLVKIRDFTVKASIKFIDETGRRWCGNVCPACRSIAIAKIYAASREGIQLDSRHVRGRAAERFAAGFFTRSGYKVVCANGRSGPDLVITSGEDILTCEVKLLSRTKRSKHYHCFPVSLNRRDDDLMALVFPDDQGIAIMPMVEFLNVYQQGGSKCVRISDPTCVPKNRSFNKAQIRNIVKKYQSGISPNKLSTEYGVNVRTIYRVLNYTEARLNTYDGKNYTFHPDKVPVVQ